MEDPMLERARLLLSAANNQNAAMRSVMRSDIAAVPSAPPEEELPKVAVESLSSLKSVQSISSDSKPVAEEKQTDTVTAKGGSKKKGADTMEKEKELEPETKDICDDPILARARLFIAAANSQNTVSSNIIGKKGGGLTVDTSASQKTSPSSSSKANRAEAAYLSPMRSTHKMSGEHMTFKCSVIKGSSLVNTGADIRHYLKTSGNIFIDGVAYQLSSSMTEWTANRIALEQDWPGETNFEGVLAVDPTGKRSPTKKKNVAVPIPASDIQGAVCQLDEFLSSKLRSNTSGSGKAQRGAKKKERSPQTVEGYEGKNTFGSTNGSNRNGGIGGTGGVGHIGLKVLAEEDSIESSRQVALNRVTEKIREEKELAKIENENKVQSKLVTQIVTERKTAELHMKTLERISQRKDVERANKLRLLQLEEEQRAAEELSHSQLDERIQKMDELRKKTLGRMRAAKQKLYEEEQEKERVMADRLRDMGLKSGRATSVPLPFNDNVQSSYYNTRIAKEVRESSSAGGEDKLHSISNKTLPPIGRGDMGRGGEDGPSPTRRKEKLSKIGGFSRIPAPVKSKGGVKTYNDNSNGSTNNSNIVFSPGGSKGRVTPPAIGEWADDYQSIIALGGDKENMLEDSLDDNSFGMFPTSPIRRNKGSSRDNKDKQKEVGLSCIEQAAPVYRNIHDGLSRHTHRTEDPPARKERSYDTMSSTNDADSSDGNKSDDNKSRMSELSAEDRSSYTNPSPTAEKKKRKSKPWRALKPIALKPFIALPVADN